MRRAETTCGAVVGQRCYGRHFLRALTLKGLVLAREEMVEPPARLNRYDYTWREAPDSEQLLGYLVGVLIRLDRSQQYEDLVERVIEVGEGAVAALREVLAQLGNGAGASAGDSAGSVTGVADDCGVAGRMIKLVLAGLFIPRIVR